MVFDDDIPTLEVLNIVLGEAGYEIEISETTHHIIDKISTFFPDLILMDNQIPDIGGVAAIQKIRTQKEFITIPVILISASTDIVSLQKNSGAEDFIRKPFDLGELEGLINKYLLTK